MNVFPIPDSLENFYKDSGHAIAAAIDGDIVAFSYMRDLVPDFESEYAHEYISDEQLRPFIEKWSGIATIHFGMVSCWEFCEL
jgi:hypothetical protein